MTARRRLACVVLAVLGLLVPLGMSARPAAAAGAERPAASGVVPITPVRTVDTRIGLGAAGPVPAGGTVVVDVTTLPAIPVGGASAVLVNVTVTATGSPGFLTVWPADTDRPLASTLNFSPGVDVANGMVVRTDASGRLAVYNGSAAPVEVVVDTSGWVPVAAGFRAVVPARVLDTREVVDGSAPLLDGVVRSVDVLGRLGLSAGAWGSVAVNLTVTDPAGSGWLRAWPSGAPEPATSNLNFTPGLTVANSAVLGLGADGRLLLRGQGGPVHVVVDVTGLFPVGRGFVPMRPVRLVDTRLEFGKLTGSAILGVVDAAADAGAPIPHGMAGAFALNVTITEPDGPGWSLAWPLSDLPEGGRPFASSSNFAAGQTVANTVVVGAGRGFDDRDGDGFPEADDAVGIHVNGTAAHVVVDLTGWFPADGVGLVSDFQESARYSIGEDRVGVVLCHPASGPFDRPTQDAVAGRFADIAAYYRDVSAGRYRPSFTLVGQVGSSGSSAGDLDCMNPAMASRLADGYDAMVVVRAKPTSGAIAYGWAGPGLPCMEASCSPGTYPANGRDGLLTLNTLTDPSVEPYWFVAAHELGHMLAWPHSYAGSPYGSSQYDNPLDVMSRPPLPNYQPRAPQLTLAFNRFAAGWLDPSLVAVHRGPSGSYVIGAIGSGSPELLVVPGTEPGAFVTLDVRQAGGWDASLATTGVTIHRVDQRSGSCTTATSQLLGGFGLRRCTNLERRQQQLGPQGVVPNSYANVVGAGSVVDLGGVVVSISDAGGGRFRVAVSGAAVTVPPLTGSLSGGAAVASLTPLPAGWAPTARAADTAVVDQVGGSLAGAPTRDGVYCLVGRAGAAPLLDRPPTA